MKRIYKKIIMIIVILLMCMLMNVSNATFEVDNKVTPTVVKVGDIVTYTITTNENIVATNFDISYENDKFKLEGSDTVGLNVAEKNGKIACIYADISGTGTKEFKVKFKAIAEANNVAFSVDNCKFRAQDAEESYTNLVINPTNAINISNASDSNQQGDNNNPSDENQQEDNNNPSDENQQEDNNNPSGGNQQGNNTNNPSDGNQQGNNTNNPSSGNQQGNNTNNPSDGNQQGNSTNNPTTNNQQWDGKNTVNVSDDTKSTQNLPNTGKSNVLLHTICIVIVVAMILKIKNRKMNDIFKAGGIMVFVIAFIPTVMYPNKVNAESNTLEVRFYNNLILEKNNALIINETEETKLSKTDVMNIDNRIIDITNLDGESLKENDNVKTKDIIKVDNGDSYSAIIYGDSNCDGIMCDTDDIMNIINDYLGKKQLEGEEKIAANLENRDELLDIDDIMVMIDTYLGKDTKIVKNIPTGNIDIETQEVKFQKISLAPEHTLALDKQGNLWTWGKYTENKGSDTPIKLETTVKFKDISADADAEGWKFGEYEDYNLVIDEAGNIWSWGDNGCGNLGNGSMEDSEELVQITRGTKFKSVVAAGNTGIALDEEGNIWTWGDGLYSKLITAYATSDGKYAKVLTPTKATSGINYTNIAANHHYASAIDEAGNIWIWGDDAYEKVWYDKSIGRDQSIKQPIQLTQGTKFVNVYTSTYTLFAIDENGSLWAMGDNSFGQLMGLSGSTKTLQKVDNKKYISAELANGDTFAIDKDGNIWACGFNQCEVLGNGTDIEVDIPQQITSGTKFKQIDIDEESFACSHAIALDEYGNIWEWGEKILGYNNIPTLLVINKEEKELEDNTGKLLKEVAKLGDYIKYPKEYTNVKSTMISSNSVQNDSDRTYAPKGGTGWRVLNNQNGVIKIMTEGCPETYTHSAQVVSYLTNSSNFAKYVDTNYAISAVGAPTEAEVTNCKDVTNWYNNSSNGGFRYRFYLTSGKVWSATRIDEPVYSGFWVGENYTVVGNGVMPVVTLKDNLVITGGYGTEEKPYEVRLSQ